MYSYKYPHPSLTADSIVLCQKGGNNYILLIQRAREPFRGKWALPGGFMEIDERLEQTARRELLEETGINAGEIRFSGIFDTPGRDPRGRTVTAVYVTYLNQCEEPHAGDDAGRARWFPLDQLPELAFDHKEIIETVIGER